MIYRIITENKNRNEIESILQCSGIEGATLIEGIGYYKGNKENCLVIEIDDLNNDIPKFETIKFIAKQIKYRNQQETVLIQVLNSAAYVL